MGATAKQAQQFIDRAKAAVLNDPMPGLFASVAIAQAALESGYGQSGLSLKYQNYFGIKASAGWKGKTSVMKTDEYENGKKVTINSGFRVYPSLQDSIADRNNFLKVNTRYTKGGVFSAKTPEDQAKALQASGYATDPNYAAKIIAIINQYNLRETDKKVAVIIAEKAKKKV